MKFNKQLSQLEAIYQVAKPVVKTAEPIHISDFIHHMFESQENIREAGLTKEWFFNYSTKNMGKAINFVNNVLQENDHIIAKKSILEGIQRFQKDEI